METQWVLPIYFGIYHNNYQVILGQISEVKLGQRVLFNTLKSLFGTNE